MQARTFTYQQLYLIAAISCSQKGIAAPFAHTYLMALLLVLPAGSAIAAEYVSYRLRRSLRPHMIAQAKAANEKREQPLPEEEEVMARTEDQYRWLELMGNVATHLLTLFTLNHLVLRNHSRPDAGGAAGNIYVRGCPAGHAAKPSADVQSNIAKIADSAAELATAAKSLHATTKSIQISRQPRI